jgi:hypothetical protein
MLRCVAGPASEALSPRTPHVHDATGSSTAPTPDVRALMRSNPLGRPLASPSPTMELEMTGMGVRDDAATAAAAAAGDRTARREDSSHRSGKVPPVSRVGRLLGYTVQCEPCGSCPVGACGVLFASLLFSLSLTAWGLLSNDIIKDVTPNTDGFTPRRTEIGNRQNTLELLFANDEKDSLLRAERNDLCTLHNICLTHNPPSSSSSGHHHRRRLGAGDDGQGGSDHHTHVPDSLWCPSNGADFGFDFTVLLGARPEGENALTAERLRAMCAWEDALLRPGSEVGAKARLIQTHCQPAVAGAAAAGNGSPGPGGARTCCRPLSVPRLVSAMAGVPCEALTDAMVQQQLHTLVVCAPGVAPHRAVAQSVVCDAPAGAAGSGLQDSLRHYAHELCGAAGGNGGLLAAGACAPAADSHGVSSAWVRAEYHMATPDGLGDGSDALAAAQAHLESAHAAHNDLAEAEAQREVEVARKAAEAWDLNVDILTALWLEVGQTAFEDDDSPIMGLIEEHIRGKVNEQFVYKDLQWAGFSFLLIYSYILISTKSVFIASLGMLHIFLSFFMSYAIYKALVSWFPFLLWLGLFVICGIGADDIFVFYDAWTQSQAMLPAETPLSNRISWVHHRAATAMLVTSFTTAGAFLSNLVNYVVPVVSVICAAPVLISPALHTRV